MPPLKPIPDWQLWWHARSEVLAKQFGPPDELIGHAVIPFDLGFELGGAADILYFRRHIRGTVGITASLIGRNDQVANSLGNYELAICHKANEEEGLDLISKLAYYTRDAVIEPGETMDLGTAVPEGSTVCALLFAEFARFEIRGRRAGVLLCIGITRDELIACRAGYRERVEYMLKAMDVWPYTEFFRQSTVQPGTWTD